MPSFQTFYRFYQGETVRVNMWKDESGDRTCFTAMTKYGQTDKVYKMNAHDALDQVMAQARVKIKHAKRPTEWEGKPYG